MYKICTMGDTGKYKAFEWDKGNIDKSYQKHGITPNEAEEIFLDENLKISRDVKHSQKEERLISRLKENKLFSSSKKEVDNNFSDTKSNIFTQQKSVPPIQGFRQSEKQVIPEKNPDMSIQTETSNTLLALMDDKNDLLERLNNNDDAVQEIILLKEIDEIYIKILSLKKESDIITEAESFYIKYKDKLIRIIGDDEYNKRMDLLKKMRK